MQTPLRTTFRHMKSSSALEARVREHVDRLEGICDRITGCHVVIEAPLVHGHKGAPFDVNIDLTVPGAQIFVLTEHAEYDAHTDVDVALRDAFDVARRLLLDHVREHRDALRSQCHLGAPQSAAGS